MRKAHCDSLQRVYLRSSWRDKMCRNKAKMYNMIVCIVTIKYIIWCLLQKMQQFEGRDHFGGLSGLGKHRVKEAFLSIGSIPRITILSSPTRTNSPIALSMWLTLFQALGYITLFNPHHIPRRALLLSPFTDHENNAQSWVTCPRVPQLGSGSCHSVYSRGP